MAEIDVKETLERFAAEGTSGAAAPPPGAIRRRRRNRRLRQATGATVLALALIALTPPVWSTLRAVDDDPAAPVTEHRPPAPVPDPTRPEPEANPGADPATKDTSRGDAVRQLEPEGNSTEAGAKQTAAYFLRLELGMKDPVAGAFKRTGEGTATVDVRPKDIGEGDLQAMGPVTVVSLRAEANGWYVTGTRTAEIRVTGPNAGATVSSPVALRGSALAFEGNVQVKVLLNRTGKDRVLGEGFVTGGGDVMRPFSGEIAYRGGSGAGWLAFFTASEADGQVLEATIIPVRLG
jgi:hypothetical protein